MMMAVMHQFPSVTVEYAFKCRNKEKVNFKPYINQINEEIDHLCTLKFTEDELKYLMSLSIFTPDFIDFLQLMQLNRSHIKVDDLWNGDIAITIKGSWYLTILFEVPVLAIVNEVYFRNQKYEFDPIENGLGLFAKKMEYCKKQNLQFVDFGTRRRFSFGMQDAILNMVKTRNWDDICTGTSNVFFAKKYGLKPVGTMAHEWLQCCQAVDCKLADSQKYALQKWIDEYRGKLAIALTDVIGIDAFLCDFDLYFAKLYDGVRHDSGDPFEFGNKVIKHYQKLGIDPMTKTIVFSDGLTVKKAVELRDYFNGRIKTSFGIGTHITNDVTGINPLQIVIKAIRANDLPVAKLSDSPEKSMCRDESFKQYLKKVFDQKIMRSKMEMT